VRHGPRPPCHAARRHHQVGTVSRHEPDKRNGWSLLGFLNDCISSRNKFRRLLVLIVMLMAFFLVLVLAYATVKGDVGAWYDHVTRHATAWLKYGTPPGAISLTLATMKYFTHRKAVRQKREVEAKKAAKKAKKAAKKKELPGNRRTAKPNPQKAAD
jgi:hypothetical protein